MKNNWTKFPVLFSLYIAQSIPMSFFSTVVPVIMRQEKYSLESIGLLQLVKLPWILKFLWAPMVDNKTRERKQLRNWIIFSEVFYAIIILSIGLFDLQVHFSLIVALMVIAFIASATQDIATDIFAIRILKPKERSTGNTMQASGSFVGSLIGTGVLLIAYYYFGWTNLLILLAAFVVFAIAPLLLYRQNFKPHEGAHANITMKEILRFFGLSSFRKRSLLLAFYYSGIIGILAMLKPYLVDLGYNVKQIGFMSGIVGTSCATLFAFLAGYIIRKTGPNSSLYLFLFVNLIAATFFWIISAKIPGEILIYTGICLLWGAYGLSTVIIYTTSMAVVREGREGTDFTIQIVITHLSSLAIAVLSGKVGDILGYRGLFGIEILLSLLAMLVLFYVQPIKRKNDGNS